MRHIFSIRLLLASALMAWTLPLHAAEQIEAPWTEVCKVAGDHRITVTTVNGDTVEGYCLAIGVDQMSVTTSDHKVIKIARAALAQIQMRRERRSHQLTSLRHGMRAGLRQEFEWLLSPYAPLGLVALPATVAWGAMAAPFCLIGDLTDKMRGGQVIKVI
jgi:hypothetical protein